MKISTRHLVILLAILATLLSSCKKEDFGEERNNLENSNQDILSNPLSSDTPCNSHPDLCNKRYDNVLFPVSYNSYNTQQNEGANSAQQYNIKTQLELGIRGLQLNIFLESNSNISSLSYDNLYLKDSINSSTQWPLSSMLKEIKSFLNSNPNEVITLFINNNSSTNLLDKAFKMAGLSEYLYHHSNGNVWPVLGRMVYDNKRLVVFTSKSEDSLYPWNNQIENHITSGRKDFENISQMNCTGNISDNSRNFFMVHHYIKFNNDNNFNTQYSAYEQINSSSFILEQLLECTDVNQSNPNFILLKNVHLGNFKDATDAINGI